MEKISVAKHVHSESHRAALQLQKGIGLNVGAMAKVSDEVLKKSQKEISGMFKNAYYMAKETSPQRNMQASWKI